MIDNNLATSSAFIRLIVNIISYFVALQMNAVRRLYTCDVCRLSYIRCLYTCKVCRLHILQVDASSNFIKISLAANEKNYLRRNRAFSLSNVFSVVTGALQKSIRQDH